MYVLICIYLIPANYKHRQDMHNQGIVPSGALHRLSQAGSSGAHGSNVERDVLRQLKSKAGFPIIVDGFRLQTKLLQNLYYMAMVDLKPSTIIGNHNTSRYL